MATEAIRRVLLLGDVVGKPGRRAVREAVGRLRERLGLDLVVANAENAAGGSGLTPGVVEELLSAGCDVLTSGDHVFRNKEVFEVLGVERRLLRPANFPEGAPGAGWGVFEGASGTRYGIVNLLGRTFLDAVTDNPFAAADRALADLAGGCEFVLADFHAEATSEKIAMRRHLDGRVAVLVGTHTHVPTADAHVTARGTAYVTDLGMTGPHDSVLGRSAEAVLHHFRTGLPARFEVAEGDVRLCGALVTLEGATRRATAIERVEERLPDARAGG